MKTVANTAFTVFNLYLELSGYLFVERATLLLYGISLFIKIAVYQLPPNAI